MTQRHPIDLQRVRHVPRELLRSQDFRMQQAASDQRRWWHNRALHDATGVASGLGVALTQDKTAVVVQPGVGYDCFGHQLLLFTPRTLPLPEGQQPMTLLARFCAYGSGREAQLRWQPVGGVTASQDCLALADLSYVDKAPTVTTVGSRSRPLARPRIGYGAMPADGTPWQLWMAASPRDGTPTPIGLQVPIDTSTAGFTEVPCYFAWLQWPGVAATHLPNLVYVVLGFQYVEEQAIDRFVFRVALPPGPLHAREPAVRGSTDPLVRRTITIRESSGEELILSFARAQRLAVCWLGIQHEPGTSDEPMLQEGV